MRGKEVDAESVFLAPEYPAGIFPDDGSHSAMAVIP